MKKFKKPYWIIRRGLAGLDFNREVIEPGTDPSVPEGGIGIRVDDDFWAVAFLPYSEYRDRPLPEIVAELWPTYAEKATYAPDHGSVEQKLHRARIVAERESERAENAERELSALRAEHDRLKAGRTDFTPRSRTRMEATNGYFIAQYEHLLVAMAHEAEPKPEPLRGVCSKCGLLVTDRVHQKQWIDLHEAGYPSHMPFHHSLGDDRNAEGGDGRDG